MKTPQVASVALEFMASLIAQEELGHILTSLFPLEKKILIITHRVLAAFISQTVEG